MLAAALATGVGLGDEARADAERTPLAAPALRIPGEVSAAGIPPRPPGSPGGAELLARLGGTSGALREDRLVAEVVDGNVPSFLRRLRPVTLDGKGGDGQRHRVVAWAMADYLAIGSDADFVRIPLGYPAAREVAARLGFALPTRKLVDAIYRQADYRLEPQPLPPGPAMASSEYVLRHQRMIEAKRAGRPLGELLAGHKKDVVLTERLHRIAGRVAIYGWHRAGGRPIQPLSTVHGATYADYSHGIRLVAETVWVDGRPRSIYDVLADPILSPLLSDEGAIREPRRLMGLPARSAR